MQDHMINRIVFAVNLVIILTSLVQISKERAETRWWLREDEDEEIVVESPDTTPAPDVDTGPNTSPNVPTTPPATKVARRDSSCYFCPKVCEKPGYETKGIKEICPAPKAANQFLACCRPKAEYKQVLPLIKKVESIIHKSAAPVWISAEDKKRLRDVLNRGAPPPPVQSDPTALDTASATALPDNEPASVINGGETEGFLSY